MVGFDDCEMIDYDAAGMLMVNFHDRAARNACPLI